MQITNKPGDNEMLVKHIRSTSSIASRSGIFDVAKLRQLAVIVDQAPELQLRLLSSGKQKGQVLKINAQGLEGGMRQKRDGIVYFGCKKHLSKVAGGSAAGGIPREIINDFII